MARNTYVFLAAHKHYIAHFVHSRYDRPYWVCSSNNTHIKETTLLEWWSLHAIFRGSGANKILYGEANKILCGGSQ